MPFVLRIELLSLSVLIIPALPRNILLVFTIFDRDWDRIKAKMEAATEEKKQMTRLE